MFRSHPDEIQITASRTRAAIQNKKPVHAIVSRTPIAIAAFGQCRKPPGITGRPTQDLNPFAPGQPQGEALIMHQSTRKDKGRDT